MALGPLPHPLVAHCPLLRDKISAGTTANHVAVAIDVPGDLLPRCWSSLVAVNMESIPPDKECVAKGSTLLSCDHYTYVTVSKQMLTPRATSTIHHYKTAVMPVLSEGYCTTNTQPGVVTQSSTGTVHHCYITTISLEHANDSTITVTSVIQSIFTEPKLPMVVPRLLQAPLSHWPYHHNKTEPDRGQQWW